MFTMCTSSFDLHMLIVPFRYLFGTLLGGVAERGYWGGGYAPMYTRKPIAIVTLPPPSPAHTHTHTHARTHTHYFSGIVRAFTEDERRNLGLKHVSLKNLFSAALNACIIIIIINISETVHFCIPRVTQLSVFTNTVGVAAASLTRDSPAFPFLRNQPRHCCRRTLTQIGRSCSCSILPLQNARSVQLRKHRSAVAIRAGDNLVLNCAATDPHSEHRFPAPSSKLYQIWLRH